MTAPSAVAVRALIVDDEPVARAAVRALLEEAGWTGTVREACDGLEALDAFREYRPDLVFLDVELPGLSGIEALEQSGISAAVVFTTAHDQSAITAFELGAIDYLRKPFGRERFSLAMERARFQLAALATARAHASPDDASAPLGDRLRLVRQAARPLTRVYVRDRKRVIPIETRDIMRCEADGDYVVIHSLDGAYHAYLNLRDLATALDPERFARVHRSHLVSLDYVASVEPHDPNRVDVVMKDGTRIVASRRGTQEIRARFRQ